NFCVSLLSLYLYFFFIFCSSITCVYVLFLSLLFFFFFFFFFNDTATTEIYTLSLHDALPISRVTSTCDSLSFPTGTRSPFTMRRSEEHTSELQSRSDLVCRLLLEKKKKTM